MTPEQSIKGRRLAHESVDALFDMADEDPYFYGSRGIEITFEGPRGPQEVNFTESRSQKIK